MIKSSIFLIIFSVIIILAALLVCDLFVRVQFHHEVNSDLLWEQFNAANVEEIIIPSTDTELHFQLKPNLDIEYKNARVRTDSEAHRISGTPVQAGPDAFRVAVLGDSSAFGQGVEYEETFAARFQVLLEKEIACSVDLRNYSVTGYNSRQEYRVLMKYALLFDPHLIILHHDHNDSTPRDMLFKGMACHPDYGNNFLHSALVKFVMRRLWMRGDRKASENAESRNVLLGGYIFSGPDYDTHIEYLKAIDRETSARNIPVILLNFYAFPVPFKEGSPPPFYTQVHKKLEQELVDTQFKILDLYTVYTDLMKAHDWTDSKPLWVRAEKPQDAHPNPMAHEVISRALFQFVRDSDVVNRSVSDSVTD